MIKKSQKRAYLFPNGKLERGTGKPGYRWVPTYSEAKRSSESIPLTRQEWYGIARLEGIKLVFCDTREVAKDKVSRLLGKNR